MDGPLADRRGPHPAAAGSYSEAWAHPAEAIAKALGVDVTDGLSRAQAAARLLEAGPNTLRSIRRRSAFAILAAQLRSVLVALLAVAAVVATLFGEWVEAAAIAAVLVLNTVVGFVTEFKAVRSMDALRELGVAGATVRRQGSVEVVPAKDLVPGDVVVLEGGDVVTADLRILHASKLQADESTLTGESLPVNKRVEPVEAKTPIAERSPMLWKGTVVTRGAGEAVVVATGMNSELGKISRLVATASEEQTPLEQRLNRLGQGLMLVTLVIAGLVVGLGLLTGQSLYFAVETAIALAVATVPEGMPVIATMALARGVRRMARHDALVNRLSAVETLGATSVICTDKTGTLTQNRLAVAELEVAADAGARRRALEIGALCNNASLTGPGVGLGEPLEVALLAAAERESILRPELLEIWPEVREVAFDTTTRLMATVHGSRAPFRVAVKGAPEDVLRICSLSPDQYDEWRAKSEALAAKGLRVLALAERTIEAVLDPVYVELTFLGLVGMQDPPREETRATLASCRRAGIRVVMATGDHPRTAAKIATQTGLVDDAEPSVVLGERLENGDGFCEGERRALLAAEVFARVSPEQKLNLIALHQAAGSVVAMTGDGVNDAPALRKANIGVAMGERGTAAAREAADIVLKDDDLSTLVPAIHEGRVIFDNIRSFVVYLLSCNLSEILVVAVAALAGLPLPLLPLQILFLNLVTDVFPALALGMGDGDANIMGRKPRDVRESLIAKKQWRTIAAYGFVLAASILGVYGLAIGRFGMAPELARTVAFLALAFAQLFHVLNMRGDDSTWLRNEVTQNKWVWAAIAICIGLVLGALYLPVLAEVLALTAPSAQGWWLILAGSLAPVLVGQASKAVLGYRRRIQAP